MHDPHDHKELITDITSEYADILSASNQGVYIYLDDTHKVCNGIFAEMLGYSSSKAWAEINEPFTDAFIAPDSQESLVRAYQLAIAEAVGSVLNVTWKKKTGNTVSSSVILVPVAYKNHIFALHFITKSGGEN